MSPQEKNNVNLSIQMIPINTSKAYEGVDAAIAVIQQSGYKYEVQPFSTIIEGPFEGLLALIERVKAAAYEVEDINELIINLQFHMKKNEDVSFEEKTDKFKH